MKRKLDCYPARVVHPSENLFFVSPTAFQPQGISTSSYMYLKDDVDKLIAEYEQDLQSKQADIEKLQREKKTLHNVLYDMGKLLNRFKRLFQKALANWFNAEGNLWDDRSAGCEYEGEIWCKAHRNKWYKLRDNSLEHLKNLKENG